MYMIHIHKSMTTEELNETRYSFVNCDFECLVISENADSSTINGLVFLRHTEVISVNSSGQLKTYDLRSSSDAPAQTLSV